MEEMPQEQRFKSRKTGHILRKWPVDSFGRTCQGSHGLKRQVEVRLWMDLNAMINKFML